MKYRKKPVVVEAMQFDGSCEHTQCEDGFCLLCGADRTQELIEHNAMLRDAAADRRMDKEMGK